MCITETSLFSRELQMLFHSGTNRFIFHLSFLESTTLRVMQKLLIVTRQLLTQDMLVLTVEAHRPSACGPLLSQVTKTPSPGCKYRGRQIEINLVVSAGFHRYLLKCRYHHHHH